MNGTGDCSEECGVRPAGGASRTLDPEGAHIAALRRLGDFRGRRVLEMGCGDARGQAPVAADAAHVLAFDPDGEAVRRAEQTLAEKLRARVTFRVAAGDAIEIPRHAFDLVVFSWSL